MAKQKNSNVKAIKTSKAHDVKQFDTSQKASEKKTTALPKTTTLPEKKAAATSSDALSSFGSAKQHTLSWYAKAKQALVCYLLLLEHATKTFFSSWRMVGISLFFLVLLFFVVLGIVLFVAVMVEQHFSFIANALMQNAEEVTAQLVMGEDLVSIINSQFPTQAAAITRWFGYGLLGVMLAVFLLGTHLLYFLYKGYVQGSNPRHSFPYFPFLARSMLLLAVFLLPFLALFFALTYYALLYAGLEFGNTLLTLRTILSIVVGIFLLVGLSRLHAHSAGQTLKQTLTYPFFYWKPFFAYLLTAGFFTVFVNALLTLAGILGKGFMVVVGFILVFPLSLFLLWLLVHIFDAYSKPHPKTHIQKPNPQMNIKN